MTPCTRKCSLSNNICSGCDRTISEIINWKQYTMPERMEIMNQIQRNISTHPCPKCLRPTYCAMNAGKSSNLCWCMFEDSTSNPDTSFDDCLCRECLNKEE